MHTDTYGRHWRYQPHPDHDLSQALQVSTRIAEFITQTDLRFLGHTPHRQQEVDTDSEPYLLKDRNGWTLWVRVDHGPLDYCMWDDIDPRIIALAIEMHGKTLDDPREAKAYDALVPAPLTVGEAWAEWAGKRHPMLDTTHNRNIFEAGFAAGEKAK
jgi:hypothetical protein